MRFLGWASCLIAVSASITSAPASSLSGLQRNGSPDGFVVTDVRVFDGERVRQPLDVVVRDGVIETVGALSEPPNGLPRIDGSGSTLLPGLTNAHAHTREVKELERALRFGVTTVLDMFTVPAAERPLRRASRERSDVAGFFSAGILATAPGGHGTEYGVELPTVEGPEEAAAFVEDRVTGGADYLKVVLNGMRAAQGIPTLDPETVRALVEAGKDHGLVVVAHIETPDDVRTAVEAGVDGLAHVWRTPGIPAGLVELIASREVFVIATLSVPDGFIEGSSRVELSEDPAVRPHLEDEVAARYGRRGEGPQLRDSSSFLEVVDALHSAGVRILAGSDVPSANVIHGVGLLRELELMVQAGLTPSEALSGATASTADAFGLTDRGRIQPGLRADLVLVEGDPTTDLTALRHIRRIWRGGVELDRTSTESTVEPSSAQGQMDLGDFEFHDERGRSDRPIHVWFARTRDGRVSRAYRLYAAAHEAAVAHGVPLMWRLRVVSGLDHSPIETLQADFDELAR